MTTDQISAAAGLLLSLLFSYVPSLNNWMAVQSPTSKRLVTLASLAGATLIVFGLTCTPLGATLHLAVACTSASAWQLLPPLFWAAVANQTAFTLSPQRQQYRMLKSGQMKASR